MGPVRHLGRLPGPEPPGPQHRPRLTDPHRPLMAHAGGHRDEPTAGQEPADVGHFGAGVEPAGLGRHPHLDVAARRPAGRVHLGVADAPPGRQPPDEPGAQDVGAGGVAVLELALHHPGDDLHLPVGMVAEPGRAPDPVVVAHHQQAVVGVVGLVVAPVAEAMPRVEPARLGPQPGRGPHHLDRRGDGRGPHDVFVDQRSATETQAWAPFAALRRTVSRVRRTGGYAQNHGFRLFPPLDPYPPPAGRGRSGPGAGGRHGRSAGRG